MRNKNSPLLELTRVLVRLDHVASFIKDAKSQRRVSGYSLSAGRGLPEFLND
jgi:hypothetical protein